MLDKIHHTIDPLIDFYQELNNLKNKVDNIYSPEIKNSSNTNNSNLVEQLIKVRKLLINKSFDDINAIYKPTAGLFLYKEQFTILENTINYYKVNINDDYPITEEGNSLVSNNDTNANNLDANNNLESESTINTSEENFTTDIINNLIQTNINFEAKLALITEKLDTLVEQNNSSLIKDIKTTKTELLTNFSRLNESIDKIINVDSYQALIKTSQDTLSTLKTSHQYIKDDISRYDALLTEHITKTGSNIVDAVEKEHIRFVQKIAAETSAITSEITKANVAELSNQRELVETNMKKQENTLIKWYAIIFFVSSFMIFACSILSSNWAANKVINNAKIFKVSVDCAATIPAKKIKSLTIIR